MAETLAAPVVGAVAKEVIDVAVHPLLEALLSRIKKNFHFVHDLKDEIRFLRDVLPKLTEVIWNAEVNADIAEMRGALQGFVEDAQDILYDYDTRTARQHHRNQVVSLWRTRFDKSFVKVRRLIPSHLRSANKMMKLYDGLKKVKTDLVKRRLFVDSADKGFSVAQRKTDQLHRRPITDEVLTNGFCLVGREKMKKEIVVELLAKPLTKPSVILVTGMGGIGKTTLVQNIFCSSDLDGHFDIKKWVCVGDELNPNSVMKKVFRRTIQDRKEFISKLEGKRFLIVLDDCWSRKLTRWGKLWETFTYGSVGSRVIITSRENITKELVGAPVKKYEVEVLSNEECLQIFESYAFLVQEPSSSSSTNRLGEVEKNILNEKIKGLPLTAMKLGSSLRGLSKDKWTFEVVENDIMPILMWSYRRLPWHLKQCFAYLSVFPKDYKLLKEHVVWMWMAQGYIQLTKDNTSLEDIGENYFDDLVGASLLQKMQNCNGSVYYNMHDLVHKLAMNVSVDGCIPYNHLSIKDSKSSQEYFDNKKKLRTLLNLCEDADTIQLQLQRARVLLVSGNKDMARTDFSEMIYLKYLDLKRADDLTQSMAICCMYNLQTLLLNKDVKDFPQCTWNLPNLRHLMGGNGIRMTGIKNSKSLHTIDCFNLFNKGEGIKELANLKELGKLKINHFSCVTGQQSASEARLDKNEYIKELVLNWEEPIIDHFDFERPGDRFRYGGMADKNQNGILEDLCSRWRPGTIESLRTLEISSYRGDQLPSWLKSNYLQVLVKLTLSWLYHVVELPPLGDLPLLEHLVIYGLRNVRCISNGFYGSGADVFPSLKVLVLTDMDGLKEWKESDSHKDGFPTCFPSLECLQIRGCSELRSMPRHLPRCLKQMIIINTGLEALPKIVKQEIILNTRLEALPEIGSSSSSSNSNAASDDHSECHIQELKIEFCPSLRLEVWFRTHPMTSLQELRLCNVDRCTDLVINYSRMCLRSVQIHKMRALRSITLSNIVPLNEFREVDYQLLAIELVELDAVEEVSIVNMEDGNITAGPLELRVPEESRGVKALKKSTHTLHNAVQYYEERLLSDGLQHHLKVEPRN